MGNVVMDATRAAFRGFVRTGVLFQRAREIGDLTLNHGHAMAERYRVGVVRRDSEEAVSVLVSGEYAGRAEDTPLEEGDCLGTNPVEPGDIKGQQFVYLVDIEKEVVTGTWAEREKHCPASPEHNLPVCEETEVLPIELPNIGRGQNKLVGQHIELALARIMGRDYTGVRNFLTEHRPAIKPERDHEPTEFEHRLDHILSSSRAVVDGMMPTGWDRLGAAKMLSGTLPAVWTKVFQGGEPVPDDLIDRGNSLISTCQNPEEVKAFYNAVAALRKDLQPYFLSRR